MTYLFATRKPGKCPNCGSSRIAKILFGMPAMSPELEQEINEGKLTLGGCCTTIPEPKWQCLDCETEIYHERDKELLKYNES